jgi:hypothetical protein
MGYRSTIAFCLSVNEVRKVDDKGSHYTEFDSTKFKEMVGFFKLTKFYEIATDTEYDCIKGEEPSLGWDDGRIVFFASDWKWYNGYPLVDAYAQMWESMQDIEGISGYFLRVGEGDGNQLDVEEDDFGDDPDYHLFAPYASMNFEGENFLGKTNTDEQEKLTMLEIKEM